MSTSEHGPDRGPARSPDAVGLARVETRALMTSLVATAVMGGAAVVWGIVSGATDAVAVLLAGGSGASGLTVLLYGVLSALGSAVVLLLLRRPAQTSALARAEVVSWRAGVLLMPPATARS